jgi:acyl-coenzyme A thioesterase PaaI-like protein
MCLVCGLKNDFGLQASFYEIEGKELLAIFSPRNEHQGYPERLHGGIAAAILDETIGRAIMLRHPTDIWGVTIELTTRFRRPVPLSGELRVVARITSESRRHFEGSGELLLHDGRVAVEGRGKYLRFPIDRIADFDEQQEEWRVIPTDGDPDEIEL